MNFPGWEINPGYFLPMNLAPDIFSIVPHAPVAAVRGPVQIACKKEVKENPYAINHAQSRSPNDNNFSSTTTPSGALCYPVSAQKPQQQKNKSSQKCRRIGSVRCRKCNKFGLNSSCCDNTDYYVVIRSKYIPKPIQATIGKKAFTNFFEADDFRACIAEIVLQKRKQEMSPNGETTADTVKPKRARLSKNRSTSISEPKVEPPKVESPKFFGKEANHVNFDIDIHPDPLMISVSDGKKNGVQSPESPSIFLDLDFDTYFEGTPESPTSDLGFACDALASKNCSAQNATPFPIILSKFFNLQAQGPVV